MSDQVGAVDGLSPAVLAARDELQNPRQLSDRIAMGRAALARPGHRFCCPTGRAKLSFSQLAALYAVGGTETLTVADLAEQIGRSPSDHQPAGQRARRAGLHHAQRGGRRPPAANLEITPAGQALLAQVDRARADQFLAIVRSLPLRNAP